MTKLNSKPNQVANDRQDENETPAVIPPQSRLPANKRSVHRLGPGRLMAGLAVLGTLLILGESWYTMLVLLVVVIYLCGEILVDQLPVPLYSAIKRNCIRRDGSWSSKREKIELNAVGKLRWDIRVILLLVLVPTMMLTYLVDQTFIPISIGFSGLTSLRFSSMETKANLADEEQAFDRWATENFFRVDPEAHKRLLWHFWPAVVLAALFWGVGCWITIKRTYSYQLKELYEGIKRRGAEYIKYDDANAF